jgi:hypothetical protein
MSISRFHAEWLSLLDISGPFLSLPVLVRRFPQGLEAHDPDHFRLLRQVHDEWYDNQQGLKPDPGIHTQWIKWVLTNTLELDDVLLDGQDVPQTLKAEIEEPQNRETLRPDMVLMDPDGKKARLLIKTYPLRQKLTRVVEGKAWKASPDTRMTQLLRDTGVTLGLVTNGDQWMLVYAPKGETSGYTSWYSTIWLEEQKTLAAFRNLLGLHRFFGVADEETLEALLAESAEDQQEVTDQLGYQVRKAVEVLVQSLDKADQDYDGKLLEEVPDKVLYEASLTVMMRLVFLFCAEERELLLLGDELYDDNYAVSTLREQLRTTADNHGEEILERRNDAWSRLLTTFRAVYAGVQHERMKLPPYGGSLFNPDRFPFLEGREPKTSWQDTPSQPLPINNRTVLHLLEALQVLQVRLPGGGPAEPRKLSFRALDIEQIGHVYEGLLDHTAIRATEPVLGLAGTRDNEPEVPLSQLEELAEKDEKELHKFLKKETGRSSVATIKKMLNAEVDDQNASRFRTACHGNEELWQRIEPFAGLVRTDTFGYPAVIVNKSVYVTAGTDRRSSGTHYTPKSLTEPIVQYTLEPLVYEGPAEGRPKTEWKLKTAAELLDLNICDMACGSGAFLVQACRYMSDRLVEAWEAVEKQVDGTPMITPLGEVSEGGATEQIIPADIEERRAYARRIVAQRCLYGVDVNPLAAEMAKLSLWLLTLAKDKPFEFLDHAIRCGDSLVGIHDIEQLKHFSLNPDNTDTPLFKGPLDQAVSEAIELRLKLEDMPSNTVEDVEAQEKLLAEADEKIVRLRCAADLLVSSEFWGENAKDKQERIGAAGVLAEQYVDHGPTDEFQEKASKERRGQRMFHWPLEFPEVIVKHAGFNAFIGNPPFRGGSRLTIERGENYRDHVVGMLTPGAKGRVDLCIYFLLKSNRLATINGYFASLVTSSVATGHSRSLGLDRLVGESVTIYRALSRFKWPGSANIHAAAIWFSKSHWASPCVVDGNATPGINTSLAPAVGEHIERHRLATQKGKTFRGVELRGDGFIIGEQEYQKILQEDPRCGDVLSPYLNGAEINRNWSFEPRQWVINFGDRNVEEAKRYRPCFQIAEQRVKPSRDKITKQIHEPCFWKFWDKRKSNFASIADFDQVLVRARDSAVWAFVFISRDYVIGSKVVILKYQDWKDFVKFQNTFHYEWCLEFGSFLGRTTMTYNPTMDLETFPFPASEQGLGETGQTYHQFRESLMQSLQLGLTDLYNRFHDADETSSDIRRLRELHIKMDQAVADAYGWDDFILNHGFNETKQGVRFTISEENRRYALENLLKLNNERFEEEVKQGLHGKKKGAKKKAAPRKRAAKNKAASGPTLFDKDDKEGS